MGIFTFFGLFSLGLYRGLTLIGILLGVFLFTRGMGGNSIGHLLALLFGIFVMIKEILDMFNYASPLNFIGVGVGSVLFIIGITGNRVPSYLLVLIGAFVVIKEIIDMLHSGQ